MKYNHKRNICLFIVMIQILTCPIMAAGVAQKKSNDLTYTNTAQLEQQIARRIGVSSQQVDALMDRGYMLEEIEHMTPEIVDSILTVGLTAEELASYYRTRNGSSAYALTATAPSGYTKVVTVPNGGGSNEWFHPDVDTTEDTIDEVVLGAESIAERVFDSTTNTIRSSYYLCGEWGEDPGVENWCHEGIDMQNRTVSTANVYSPISGYVSKSSTSGKYVNIYNEELGITVNFQHLNNVDGTGDLVEGSYVEEGQYLGNQNTTDNHVHMQVCTHTECTSVHSGRDLTLHCERPDWYF